LKACAVALCAITLFLFFCNLGVRDFWAPDEGDFAEIARELNHDLVVPHLNGAPYGEKPPFFYYLVHLSGKAFPFLKDETSTRIPTAFLSFLFMVFFLFSLWRFFGARWAIVSSFVMITSPLYYWQARYLQVDMVFSLFVASSLLCYLWFFETERKVFQYLVFILTAFAFMTKGPLSLVLVAPVILVHMFLHRNFRFLTSRSTLWGSLIFAGIVLPWYLAVYTKEGLPYLYENIIRQNITRFVDAWSHRRPVYYYFTTLPLDFFPWVVFLPLGIYMAVTEFRKDPKVQFLLFWFVWMFLFFSFSSGKISKYMLPLLPALSAVTACGFMRKSGYSLWAGLVIACVFLASGLGLFFARPDLFPEFRSLKILCGSIAIAASAGLFVSFWKKKTLPVFITLAASIVLLYSVANIGVYGKWNVYKTPRRIAEKVKGLIADGSPWVYYGSIRGGYIYYTGTLAIHVDEHDTKALREAAAGHTRLIILTRKRDLGEVSATLGAVEVACEEKVGDTPMVILRYIKGHG